MRWSRLFDDLEAQLVRLEAADLESEIAERARSERGQASLVQALVADTGRDVTVRVLGLGPVSGAIADVGQDWLMLDSTVQGPARRRSALVPLQAVQSVAGLSGFLDQREGASQRRFGLRSVLRALGRDRTMVRVQLSGGWWVQGTIDRVGRDHCDLAEHPDDAPRRNSEVRAVQSVPFWAMAAIRQI